MELAVIFRVLEVLFFVISYSFSLTFKPIICDWFWIYYTSHRVKSQHFFNHMWYNFYKIRFGAEYEILRKTEKLKRRQ